MAHLNQVAGAVDVCEVQISALLQLQAARVDGREADFLAWQLKPAENLAHFGAIEDDGQFLFRGGPHNAKDGPLRLERLLIAEADATDGNGHGGARIMFAVLEEEEYWRSSSSVIRSGDL